MRPSLFAVALAVFVASPAQALCYYRGELYAKTSLSREYHDAGWVVRARVLSGKNRDGGTLYRLQVVGAFKGKLPKQFLFWTERNSGGFYLDNNQNKPDIDGEYLLFLTRTPRTPGLPAVIQNSMTVNYNCGQSKPWRTVSSADRTRLASSLR